MTSMPLDSRLVGLKRRLLAVVLAGGFSWALAAALALLLVCMWLDLAIELPPGMRIICSLLAVIAGLVLLVRSGWIALRSSLPLALARRLDQAGGTSGQILSGTDFLVHRTGAQGPTITAGMAQLAIQRAANLADRVAPDKAVPARSLFRPLSGLGSLVLGIGLIAAAAPRLAATQWLRFIDPFGDHPPYSRLTFQVEPGDASVVYGKGLDLRVRPEGSAVDRIEAILQVQGGAEETLPMFPESSGAWRATIAQITAPLRYYVRAPGSRSGKYQVTVITVPRIESVRFRITPPAYTNQPPYEGPLPQGGVAGLPGTKVDVFAKSNRPLSGGKLELTWKEPATQPTSAPSVASVASPAQKMSGDGKSNVATGTFVIQSAGTMKLNVTDVQGQDSTDTFFAPIAMLHDDRPFVRLMEPKPISFATPDVSVQVVALAEDDYGVSRVQLYRGLNESRVRPEELAVPTPNPRRFPAQSQLKLSDYGLNPGDVVKLYARVEDNDPAGPKGSESPIATIRIVSQQDMDRMQLSRDAMEVLQSKYDQAERRLEGILEEIQKVEKELEKLDPESELAKEQREALSKLAEKMDEERKAIEASARQDLPFDLDKALKPHLSKLADKLKEAGEQTKALAKSQGVGNAKGYQKMEQIRKELAGEKEEFQEEATKPLEHLAKVMPLKEDEGRFIELYQRQRELEQRLHSVEGQEGKDDPKLKARIRDLEAEQDQIRQDLQKLLDDIESHAAQLPAEPELEPLRQTAFEFSKAVSESQASPKMTEAQTALSEFAGTRAQLAAKEAADILEKFLSKCQSMGDEAGNDAKLKFNPGLADAVDATVEQMMEAMGMGSGKMNGMGTGQGGYSARRSSLSNVGLYGRLPTRSQGGGGNARDRTAAGAPSRGQSDPDNEAMTDPKSKEHSAGEAAAAVPTEYKRRVGEYFQRVADELGEEKK